MPLYPFKGDYAKLSAWIKREYSDAIIARRRYVDMLDEWDRQYEARPRVASKTFPWAGASNLEVPVGATHTDTVVSRLESAYFATLPWVIVRDQSQRFSDHASALADYMNAVSLPNSRYRDEKAIDLLTTAKLGTSFQWLTYVTDSKRVMSEQGNLIDVNMHEGPLQCSVHPRDLIAPPDARNIQRSRWITVRSYKTWGELIHGKNRGIYIPEVIDGLDGRGFTYMRDHELQRERRQGVTRSSNIRQWEMPTMYALYQESPKDEPVDIWVTFHYPSGEIASAYYNPYIHYEWPLSRSLYMFREDAFYGIGIMGMISMIEEEVTMIHNYCLDNLLAANTVVAKVRQNSVEQLDIFPMSRVDYTGDKDSVIFERLGTALSGQQVGEAAANAYAERRTGVGDSNIPRLGSFQGAAGVRTPATTTLALIGEGNKRFELAIDVSKRADSELLRQHAMLLKQYWPRLVASAQEWDQKKANLISELFQQSATAIRQNIIVEVAASTIAVNKEAEQRNMMLVAQFMQAFYELFLQYIQIMIQAPQLENVIRKILDGASTFVERILRTFDIRDPDQFIPRIDDIGARAVTQPASVLDELGQTFLNGASSGAANGAAVG